MTEIDPASWNYGLQRNGLYYEGVVLSVDDRLEAHKRDTVTTWGTRTSCISKSGCDGEKKTTVSITSRLKIHVNEYTTYI